MKYLELRKKIRSAVFSLHDLRLLGLKIFNYQLSLWQKQGHILKLKNGLYVFEEQASSLLPEEIAPLLYSPSYISLEKALSRYGFIPEVVYAVTSITPKTTRSFKNWFGNFSYRHVKPSLFFGYREIKEAGHKFLLAEPEKALLDFIYLNLHKIKSKDDITAFRLNAAGIKKIISRLKFKKYLASFRSRKMENAAVWIMGGE